MVASRGVTSLSGMDDFGKKVRKPRGRKVADLHRGLFLHSLGKLAPPQSCFCTLIQTKIFLSTVTVSFPCLRAQSLNKELQLISCEAKWNASAIQSDTLGRLQLAHVPSPSPRAWISTSVAALPLPSGPLGLLQGPGSQDSLPLPPKCDYRADFL